MADSTHVIEYHEYEEEVNEGEEVVETSYMCGECFLLFPTTEHFNEHQCHITNVQENTEHEQQEQITTSTSCISTTNTASERWHTTTGELQHITTGETELTTTTGELQHTVTGETELTTTTGESQHTVTGEAELTTTTGELQHTVTGEAELTTTTGESQHTVTGEAELTTTTGELQHTVTGEAELTTTTGESQHTVTGEAELTTTTGELQHTTTTGELQHTTTTGEAQRTTTGESQHITTTGEAQHTTTTGEAQLTTTRKSLLTVTGESQHTTTTGESQHTTTTGETEAAMEEAVASILGERMKRNTTTTTTTNSNTTTTTTTTTTYANPRPLTLPTTTTIIGEDNNNTTSTPQFNINNNNTTSTLQFNVNNNNNNSNMQVEGVEIPSTNLYVYDNASYLHKLMKDNTFGRRVRHDAPYTHRLGPWDNKSSRLLIQLLNEYPKAYFILDKEMKRTEAWEIIRLRLSEAGYQFTVLQIRMRWRELCKKYRTTVNHNDLHNTRKTCQYFDDLNNLFGVWDKNGTLLLIRQLDTNCRKGLGQNGGTRMRIRVWEHIRQVLAAHGYQYTADQVQGRWSNLVTLYQHMIEHNSKPHNEHITIAFKEHIQRVFVYVPERNSKWMKIMEKRGKTPKAVTKRWTLPLERILLAGYQERVYRFNNEIINNNELWQEIVKKLEDEADYQTTVDKVRSRFHELAKQFSNTEQHNTQPGTIRRECRHHHTISQIYSVYNYWPHDKSTIKMENSNAIRMRQVNAQLGWTDDESRMLLQLYPQVLVGHLSSGDHQPIEELWLQLAKAFMSTQHEKKQCYELEEHLWLLRRGHHNTNPFPFTAEMQLVEETETTLGFTDTQQQQQQIIHNTNTNTTTDIGTTGRHQLLPYWGHTAAHTLLDLVLHFRQEGIRNTALFEMISRNMDTFGYKYSGEECRTYYTLLRQLYTNRLRTIKRKKELIKPFPYMEKMAEIDGIHSQHKFTETDEKRQLILKLVQERIEGPEERMERPTPTGGKMEEEEEEEEEREGERETFLNWITKLKMTVKSAGINPPPPVKVLAQILLSILRNASDVEEPDCVLNYLASHVKLLTSMAEQGGCCLLYHPPVSTNKAKKIHMKTLSQKYSSVQWTENNLRILLNTVKEWRIKCHDELEFEHLLTNAESMLWKDVTQTLNKQQHKRLNTHKCHHCFNQLCGEYRNAMMTLNTRSDSQQQHNNNNNNAASDSQQQQHHNNNNTAASDSQQQHHNNNNTAASDSQQQHHNNNNTAASDSQQQHHNNNNTAASDSQQQHHNNNTATTTVPCQDIVDIILSPFVCHQAQMDFRDEWWTSEEEEEETDTQEETGNWTREETINLLFTVREFWPNLSKTDWQMVSDYLASCGYQRHDHECEERFGRLYENYESANNNNNNNNKKIPPPPPPYYFKIHTLFTSCHYHRIQPIIEISDTREEKTENDATDDAARKAVVINGLRQLKGHHCHTLPRLPLLTALAKYVNEYLTTTTTAYTPMFTPLMVWQLMIDLHQTHMESRENGEAVLPDLDLGELWEYHHSPLVAFGLHAQSYPDWQKVSEWSVEEVYILLESIITLQLKTPSHNNNNNNNNTFQNSQNTDNIILLSNIASNASRTLKEQGYTKTPSQCQDHYYEEEEEEMEEEEMEVEEEMEEEEMEEEMEEMVIPYWILATYTHIQAAPPRILVYSSCYRQPVTLRAD
ncbi:hypothetical protein Pmani_030027 [Petrolisthes manimaculis]|uniref:Myb-like domain-containing protein n=1 Tax=Petrolisthes manimaculis TaxID=1843537 RepID=A0AAE1TWD4_9EUCA|nr:hypothetical protein Pmani_030027 [Petrolisthes manimaculis]